MGLSLTRYISHGDRSSSENNVKIPDPRGSFFKTKRITRGVFFQTPFGRHFSVGHMAQLRYDPRSIRRFENYFATQPKPRPRGRPKKKRRRGRPKKNAADPKQTMLTQQEDRPHVIDLTVKEMDELDARIEGEHCKRSRLGNHKKRINWDLPPDSEFRKRVADSWTKKTDLYKEGESYCHFCIRMG